MNIVSILMKIRFESRLSLKDENDEKCVKKKKRRKKERKKSSKKMFTSTEEPVSDVIESLSSYHQDVEVQLEVLDFQTEVH
jgi:hypothetical protein